MRTIKLMADYHCFPLWEDSPGVFGNIDPRDLSISSGLQDDLENWSHDYDETLNLSDPASSRFPSDEAEARFKQKGRQLADQLRTELGPTFTVLDQI